ncbi:transposase [Haliangium ochraceum]|uniref:transposase n=1 Tax=Haliangium ochraceum TaxID=80816 RepID=UPI003B832E52
MSYAGLVPSEHSSGGPGKAKRGGITKTGNAHLRRVLVESSWHDARRARPSVTAEAAARGRQPGGARARPQGRASALESLRASHAQG